MRIKLTAKKMLYFCIYYSGALYLLIRILQIVSDKHRGLILFYHRFHDGKPRDLLPSLDVREFEDQLGYIRRMYRLVSMDTFVGMLKDEKSFNTPTIAVTIDDGYLNNYTLAYPIIRMYKVPVMIYLTAGLIGTNKGLWIDEIEFYLRLARVKSFSLPEVFKEEEVDISTDSAKRTALKRFYVALLPCSNDERTHAVSELRRLLLITEDDILKRDRIMLNWEEVAEMAGNGVLFGAHTLTHPFLPNLPQVDAQEEISKSREFIEARIVREVRHFAIPNGTRNDFTEDLTGFCRKSGFCSVVTTEGGAVRSGDDLFTLKRVLPPPPTYYFACEVSRYLFIGPVP